jgi:hypothetical protein
LAVLGPDHQLQFQVQKQYMQKLVAAATVRLVPLLKVLLTVAPAAVAAALKLVS